MRLRALSFISQWGGGNNNTPSHSPVRSGTPASPSASPPKSPKVYSDERPLADTQAAPGLGEILQEPLQQTPTTTAPPSPNPLGREPQQQATPNGSTAAERRHSRRGSMVIPYIPTMAIEKDTPAELQPIFTHLNNHANKLYQEGYFLKLHDLDSRGRPSSDRVWAECFAQLVGTVLSLWDAAQLDAAGEDGEVMPTFINLTDASIRMIESLPMDGPEQQSLQNVLSISTAANNRYLLHFNSLHSLTQWTAGIRLSMYEHSCLQEAYTGSIIAGKGKHLNGIRTIMERARFPTEDWARVRFGAGTPWRRCWCVITPPDEKEAAKASKAAKKSAYVKAPAVKGDIKFYETRKITKKTRPIAVIKDAYTAYAIYPQAKALIDQSTLIKVDGSIVIPSHPETTTDGFVFVMPEVHPGVTGFEMMIRWLMPAYDTFSLYGRPARLIPDVLDVRSLMFAMPRGPRYGHLDLIDVAGLIHTEGSIGWSEREWRKQLKNLTSRRMTAASGAGGAPLGRAATGDGAGAGASQVGGRSSLHLAAPGAGPGSARTISPGGGVRFEGPGAARSTPGSRQGSPSRERLLSEGQRNTSDTALSQRRERGHQRSASEAHRPAQGSRLSFETPPSRDHTPPPPPAHQRLLQQQQTQQQQNGPPLPPAHGVAPSRGRHGDPDHLSGGGGDVAAAAAAAAFRSSSSSASNTPPLGPEEFASHGQPAPLPVVKDTINEPLRPVVAPPSMSHRSNAAPPRRPNPAPDMRRANVGLDSSTLAELKDANPAASAHRRPGGPGGQSYSQGQSQSQGYGGGGNGGGSGYAPQAQQPYHHPNGNGHAYGPDAGQAQLLPVRDSGGMVVHSGQYVHGGGRDPRQHMPPPSWSASQQGTQGARLSTIPGTPAVERDNFDLAPGGPGDAAAAGGSIDRARSAASINRKPVPGASVS